MCVFLAIVGTAGASSAIRYNMKREKMGWPASQCPSGTHYDSRRRRGTTTPARIEGELVGTAG